MTSDGVEVSLTGGLVRGIRHAGMLAWRGIPYAAPPIGQLRFRAPVPGAHWDGVRDATRFGPVAAQDRKGPFVGAKPGLETSEDCLTLNVIAPDAPGSGLPVMVYIHGGAYSVGAPPNLPDQGGNFVRRGVVHVTFNYRLNAFGYLDFSRYGLQNNLGLRDQVAALEWVRDNIAAFGGDPAQVTLYGESSGGNAVTTLMATPAARGLFARAIAQSPPANAVYSPPVTQRWAARFMSILGIPAGHEAEALRSAETMDLVTAARKLFAEVPDTDPGAQAFSPVIDGDYLPRHPLAAFGDGQTHPVPLIIGTNDREGAVFTGRRRILATTPQRIAGLLAATPPAAAAHLKRTYGYPSRRAALDFGGDFAFWLPAQRAAEGHSRTADTWLYRLDYSTPLLRLLHLDATHGADLVTVFGRTRDAVGRIIGLLGGRRALHRLSERMQDHWFRFAAEGTVDPLWSSYDALERQSIVFDTTDRVVSDSRGDRRKAWEEYVPAR